jgi:hypothetical protein
MAGLVWANYRGRVPQRVARTSWTMTKVEWQYVNVNGDWYYSPGNHDLLAFCFAFEDTEPRPLS